MKQLLHQFQEQQQPDGPIYWVAGLKEKALVGVSGSPEATELVSSSTPKETQASNDDKNDDKDMININKPISPSESNDIQAVACQVLQEQGEKGKDDGVAVVFVAVARANKLLEIYKTPVAALPSSKALQPLTIHKSPKRISSMCFAQVPQSKSSSSNSNNSQPLTVLVTGDLVGDVWAYSLTHASVHTAYKESEQEAATPHRRLLLGHTASMLTTVQMSPQGLFLLSADRDEKIRVTHFPVTTRIRGFLLGHEAYVSSVDVCDDRYCVSVGGDGALRVWDYAACDEVATLELASSETAFGTDAVPTKVTVCERISDKSFLVGVIYEACSMIDTFVVTVVESSEEVTIQKSVQIDGLKSQPLAIIPWKKGRVAILRQEADCLVTCQLKSQGAVESLVTSSLLDVKDLPDSVLEKDRFGNISMDKNTETRGPAMIMPWNDAARKETARTRNKRTRAARKERQKKKQMMLHDGYKSEE